MRIKVHDGTVNHGDRPLCATCTHSTIILGETLDQRIIECRAGIMQALLIPFRVTSCTRYTDSRVPSYAEMVQTAWILQPHRNKRRAAGFVRGEDLEPREFAAIVNEGPDET
jgi:hypothetical protein